MSSCKNAGEANFYIWKILEGKARSNYFAHQYQYLQDQPIMGMDMVSYCANDALHFIVKASSDITRSHYDTSSNTSCEVYRQSIPFAKVDWNYLAAVSSDMVVHFGGSPQPVEFYI